jgi:hypothetical protein
MTYISVDMIIAVEKIGSNGYIWFYLEKKLGREQNTRGLKPQKPMY